MLLMQQYRIIVAKLFVFNGRATYNIFKFSISVALHHVAKVNNRMGDLSKEGVRQKST